MKYYGAFVKLGPGKLSKVIFLKFCDEYPLFKVVGFCHKSGLVVPDGVSPKRAANGFNAGYRAYGWQIVSFRSISAQLRWIAKVGK